VFVSREASGCESELQTIFAQDDSVSVARMLLPNEPGIEFAVLRSATLQQSCDQGDRLWCHQCLLQVDAVVV